MYNNVPLWLRHVPAVTELLRCLSVEVAVGYVYENCARRPYWEVQSAKIAGNDMMSSEIGGWNVDVHHVYSVQEGIIGLSLNSQ